MRTTSFVTNATCWPCTWIHIWLSTILWHFQSLFKSCLLCNAILLHQVILVAPSIWSCDSRLLLTLVSPRIKLIHRRYTAMNKSCCFTVCRIVWHKYTWWSQLPSTLKLRFLYFHITMILSMLSTTWRFWIQQLVWILIYCIVRSTCNFSYWECLFWYYHFTLDKRAFSCTRRFLLVLTSLWELIVILDWTRETLSWNFARLRPLYTTCASSLNSVSLILQRLAFASSDIIMSYLRIH